MHELSIAHQLVDIASKAARDAGMGKVQAVHVRLGVLSGVVREALLFAFDVVTQGTAVEGARLVIEDVPVKVYCRACRAERVLPQPFPMRCPACGERTGEVLEGREIELYALEEEELENAAEYGPSANC